MAEQYVDPDYWGEDYAADENMVHAAIPVGAVSCERVTRHAAVSAIRAPSVSHAHRANGQTSRRRCQ